MTCIRKSPPIERSFRDLSDADIADIERAFAYTKAGWSGSFRWDELLRSRRVLIVSEAGSGKTYECQTQQIRLWKAGESAFFLDLATLSGSPLRDMLSAEEEERFDEWLRSQSEIATFFLDSYDELKLTLGKFDQALRRLNKALAGQLGRVRIIITTRPVPIERALIERHLPLPEAGEAAPTAEAFADMMEERGGKKPACTAERAWRNVGLMPLSREQMRAFMVARDVPDPDALLADIRRRDAEAFAERPQDLIELCADWRDHRRIRTHREQIETNIATKLTPRSDRKESADLSQAAAIDGASRLALAAMLTRKLTLRHRADADSVRASEAALDVSTVLQDWGAEAQTTLLERALFGFASYGRVRFHHRSVMEFLAAKRLEALLARGVAIKAIKRLLFAETAQGIRTVRPSMRPVAAWLASSRDTIFDAILACDPAVILDYGDPQALRPAQRIRALEAYADRYGRGGWRGLNVPYLQVHRFATPELDGTVRRILDRGVENQEVRHLLLKLIAAGKLGGCADIAHAVAMDAEEAPHDRRLAVEALVQVNDARLEELSASVEAESARWPDVIAPHVVIDLFPEHMPVARISTILGRIQPSRSVGGLRYWLPIRIETETLAPDYLDALREALTSLVSDGIAWDPDTFPHLATGRPDLVPALVAACRRQAIEGVRTPSWIASTLLSLRLAKADHGDEEALVDLQRALAELPVEARETAFWQEDTFLMRFHQYRDAWHRVLNHVHYSGIRLTDEADVGWIRRRLSDRNAPLEHREMMLWAEVMALNRAAPDHGALLESLRPLVADAPSLTALIDERLKPQERSAAALRMEARNAERIRQIERRDAKARTSWVTFWRAVVRDPDAVFAADRAEHTAWNLWRAVERSGQDSRASGWNRRFIERQFGKATADRLRETMMVLWRNDRPTLRSERPESEKGTFLVRWQLGLAGIAAEAEDVNWADRLTEQEAELACRYAPLELNGFPSWLGSLAVEHPSAVDRVLGEELSFSLRATTDAAADSMFLQNIRYASGIVAKLFVPRIRGWLTQIAEVDVGSVDRRYGQDLRQAIAILLKIGSDDDRRFLAALAAQRLAGGFAEPFANLWLSALLHLDADTGVEALERGLSGCPPSQRGRGVQMFAELFQRDYGESAVDLQGAEFTPALLVRLLRLAYQHVRLDDDAQHEGSYSPDTRDDAERSRSAILSALLATTGMEGWTAKLEMADDPLFAHMRDRTLMLARERAAEEVDNAALSERAFVVLDSTGEAPPMTREAMFELMRDRIDDIDDLLLQDISPRALWATIIDEHVMRRELARALRNAANQSYTIDQEAVTADEMETDIRFRSAGSGQQGTIELKLGDERSGRDLFDTIRNQLLTKYMAADECRAGCLVVTIAKNRRWEHPQTGERIGFEALMTMLADEADRLSHELGGTVKLMAKGIDLRPRLGPA